MTELMAGTGGGEFSAKMALGSMVGGIPPKFAGSVALDGDFTESFPLRFEFIVLIGNSFSMELSFTKINKGAQSALGHP